MAKISQIAADLDLKKKSIVKTRAALKTLEVDFKKIATEQQKAEAQAKSEKDLGKKKLAQDKSYKLRAEGEELLKKRPLLEKSLKELEKSELSLTEQLKTMTLGLAAFGKARSDYLEWFKGAKQELDGELSEGKKYLKAAEKHRDMTEKLLANGAKVKAAEEAGAAAKMAEFARASHKKVDDMVTSWGNKQWSAQRNLAPSEYGVEGADVKVHDTLTKKVYATFTLGDAGRGEANVTAEKTETAANEAEMILNAGDNVQAKFEQMIAQSKTLILKKIKDYDSIFGTTWGKIAIDEGARFRSEANMVKPGEQLTIARALKVAEQARSAVPKMMVNAEIQVKLANEIATKERGRIPKSLQRSLKPQLDELGNLVIGMIRTHKENQAKFQKSMTALDGLEKTAGKN